MLWKRFGASCPWNYDCKVSLLGYGFCIIALNTFAANICSCTQTYLQSLRRNCLGEYYWEKALPILIQVLTISPSWLIVEMSPYYSTGKQGNQKTRKVVPIVIGIVTLPAFILDWDSQSLYTAAILENGGPNRGTESKTRKKKWAAVHRIPRILLIRTCF